MKNDKIVVPGALIGALQQLPADAPVERTIVHAVARRLFDLVNRPVVFGTPRYRNFAKQLVAASNGRLELGVDERKRHADGKGWHRYITPIKGREVILVGGTQTDSDQMELVKMGYAAWQWKAYNVTFLVPYHGDARQERWKVEGESVDGAYTSMMLAKVPKCPGGNEVLLVDIHADAITGIFIGGEICCRNIDVLDKLIEIVARERSGGQWMLMAKPRKGDDFVMLRPGEERRQVTEAVDLIEQPALSIKTRDQFAILAPDAGRGKITVSAARRLGLRPAIAIKTRVDSANIQTEGLIGDVDGCVVLLSDDLAVTFSSALGVAEQAHQSGAREIIAMMTHGVIPSAKYVQKLIDSGLFSALYITDSLPHVYRLAKTFPNFVRVVPLAPLLVPELVDA